MKRNIKARMTGLALAFLISPASVLAEKTCDSVQGEKMFRKCAICHANDQTSKGGAAPNLFEIIGRDVASETGFPYSQAMEDRGGQWTEEKLNKFLENPITDMPGTLMAFAGFKKEQDRRDILCYLRR